MRAVMLDEAAGVPPIVLVVDDDADTRDLYDLALTNAGMWVSQAAEARQGFETALELKPDAIITDLEMPGMSGVDLLHQLRADERTREVPVIAVTGWDLDRVPDSTEFAAVILKPVGIEQLVRDVRAVLARSKALRQRGDAAVAKIPGLLDRSRRVIERSHTTLSRLSKTLGDPRLCPLCERPLQFSEIRRLDGTEFEYFAPCTKGCGLFCYDRERRRMVTLFG